MYRHKFFCAHAVGELSVVGLNLQPSVSSVVRPGKPSAHIGDDFVGMSGDSVVCQFHSHLNGYDFLHYSPARKLLPIADVGGYILLVNVCPHSRSSPCRFAEWRLPMRCKNPYRLFRSTVRHERSSA